MYTSDSFNLGTANCTFYLTFDKYNMTTYTQTASDFIPIPRYIAVLTLTKSRTESLVIREYILVRYNLDVVQNTTFEEVSSEVRG